MKPFITISRQSLRALFIVGILTAAAVLPADACMWVDNHNYFLFSTYNRQEFSQRVGRLCDNNWKAYLGKPASEYYFFDADEIKDFARKKGDLLMVSYVEHLEQYLSCATSVDDGWEYPTKAQLAERSRKLATVRGYALSKIKSRLRSQHALLYMRCNMLMGRHSENITFWEQTASKYVNSVYRDMMKNIYGGALLRTGRTDEAWNVYAEQEDGTSLMVSFFKKRSFAAISQEYSRNPNSSALPFLVQDFVNNTQEAVDAQDEYSYWPGKLYVREISVAEARQMAALCRRVVSEGKSCQPVLWQSALAWIEFLLGDRQQALADIQLTNGLGGSGRLQENARVLRLYIKAAASKPGADFDNFIATELQWLAEKSREEEERYGEKWGNHYTEVFNRLLHQQLVGHYAAAGRSEVAAALLSVRPDMALPSAGNRLSGGEADEETGNNYGGYFFSYADTMKVENLRLYADYAATPAATALDQWLKPRLFRNDIFITDLIGTKYLRLRKWQEAIDWLQRVPMSFICQQGFAYYAAHRSYKVEPWIKRQWLKEREEYGGTVPLKTNQKIDFAREMMKLEAGLALLSPEEACQRQYDLAVRYAQADFTGDCWYLMRYGKSLGDTVRANETDMAAHAKELLRKASQSKNFQLKERALYALCYTYICRDAWYSSDWNDAISDWQRNPRPETQQYQAWAALAKLEKEHAGETSQYVSRCDEYIQFRKAYK